MKRFLVFAGLDGDLDALKVAEQYIAEKKPDAILFAGGVGREDLVSSNKHSDITPEQTELYHAWFKWLGQQNIPAMIVAGKYDVPLEDYLRAGMNAESEYGTVHLVEGSVWEHQDVAVGGAGGELTERTTSLYPVHRMSRTMAEYALRDLAKSDASLKIMLLAEPPQGKLGGEAGADLAGELIDSFHPSLAVVSGPTSSRGVDRVAKTYIINPGHLADGSAAWVDWSKAGDDRIEFLDAATPANR